MTDSHSPRSEWIVSKRWPTFLVLACLVFLSVGMTGTQGLSLEPPEGLRSFVDGNTNFALEIYTKLAPAHSNLFLSPYSLSAALAVAHASAQASRRRSRWSGGRGFGELGDDERRRVA